MKEPRTVHFQDKDHRDLEATIETDEFTWQLWVDIETKDAVVSKRFKEGHRINKWKVTIPEHFVDYEHVLREFIGKQTKK
jgi:hypothetical protein